MAYINNNSTRLYECLHLGYLKNKHKQTTNPMLCVHMDFNLLNNETTNVSYTVRCFENKETFGYTYKTFDNYTNAKECYDELFVKYHII